MVSNMPESGESSPAAERQSKGSLGRNGSKGEEAGGKSTRDWLKIVVPLVVAVATIWASTWFGFRQLNEQHEHDLQLAQGQYQETTLQTYIDNIRNLLLNHKLAKSASQDTVSQLARVQTLNTLRNLNANQNRIVLQFLHDAGLIRSQNSVLNLSNADLTNADLTGANLSNLDLNGATLTGAQLNGADLSGATLNGANLDGAQMKGADLSNSFLFDAELNRADLSHAALNEANLNGTSLSDATMKDTTLTGASLGGAILTRAQLNGANMSAADLSGANLAGADLSGADLSDTILTAAGLTQGQMGLTHQQLDTVKSCTFAALPAKWKCPHQPAITLKYWFTENPTYESHVIWGLIRQFETDNPKIHIKAVNTNYYQTETAFKNPVQESQAPDILRSDVTWVAQLASQGYLLNIDPYIRNGLSGYLSVPLSYDRYGGHYYGLPQVTDFLALLYNKRELAKAHITAPATMANFKTDVKKIVTSGAAQYGFETPGTGYSVLPFLYSFGGGMLGRHDRILINDAGSINGLEFLLKLQDLSVPGHNGAKPVHVNFSSSQTSDALAEFAEGKAAMIFGGPYDVDTILRYDPSISLGVASIPACPTGIATCRAGQARTPSGGQSYVISAGTLHPREAYKFISFMSSKPSQIKIAEENQTLPTRTSAYTTAVSNEHFIKEFDMIEKKTVVRQPGHLQSGHLLDLLDPQIAAALDGAAGPTAALNTAAYDWKQLLAGS